MITRRGFIGLLAAVVVVRPRPAPPKVYIVDSLTAIQEAMIAQLRFAASHTFACRPYGQKIMVHARNYGMGRSRRESL